MLKSSWITKIPTILLKDIAKPKKLSWNTILEAMEDVLALEKDVNESLLSMHLKASEHNDAHLTDFLEGNFLDEQVQGIKKIADLVTKMKRVGEGLGWHLMDKDM